MGKRERGGWLAAWLLSSLVSLGIGIHWGERTKMKELRDSDDKWNQLMKQEHEQNRQLRNWVEKMEAKNERDNNTENARG